MVDTWYYAFVKTYSMLKHKKWILMCINFKNHLGGQEIPGEKWRLWQENPTVKQIGGQVTDLSNLEN